jgi:RHS repeat-associated protein
VGSPRAVWDTVTGFTGQVDTPGLLEFASRTYDPASRVWLQDDAYRGTAARASSMNRYAYVEGAPESFVDALGFHRAAAALQQQRLAAAQAACQSAR